MLTIRRRQSARCRPTMPAAFEELDYHETPQGGISLRRRAEPRLAGRMIYEVKLGDEFLMSSLFTEGEIQLARLALAQIRGRELDIVVGGLGLGYTAHAALADPRVRSLLVIEKLAPVIRWHHRGLVPLGGELNSDPRCTFVQEDFFKLSADASGFDRAQPARRFHGVLLDIDHSPGHWLDPHHRGLYTGPGLRSLAGKLHRPGVFALWSNEAPDREFTALLGTVFDTAAATVVSFPNPYTGGKSSNTVYLAGNP